MAKFNAASNLCAVLLIMEASGYRADNTIYSNKAYRRGNTNENLRFLDTLSVALASGNKGDVVAAAFDTRLPPGDVAVRQGEFTRILLANNNPRPSDTEKQAANELFAKLADKDVKTVDGLFDYLLRHCHRSMMRRMDQLRACMNNDLTDEFSRALQIYKCEEDVWSAIEFPRARERLNLIKMKMKTPKSFTILWNAIIRTVKQETAHFIGSLNEYNANKSEAIRNSLLKQLKAVAEWADALIRSKFLTNIISQVQPEAFKASRFSRRLRKVRQYVNGMNKLIERAKGWNLAHVWVEDQTEAGTYFYDGNLEANVEALLKESPYRNISQVSNFLKSRGSKQSILDKDRFSRKATDFWNSHYAGF